MILPPFLCGLDVGQTTDPTALCIQERHVVGIGEVVQQEYQCRHLERFKLGTPYPDIAEKLSAYLKRLPRPAAWQEDVRRVMARNASMRRIHTPLFVLIIDGTGVGRPVVEMFARLAVNPIMVIITTGHQVTSPSLNEWHVPKSTLVGALQVALQTRRFKAPRQMPEAATLVKEMQNFRFKISASGQDSYEAWRENQHDDLVLAASLATWYGEHTAPPPPRPFKPMPTAPHLQGRSRTGV